METIIDYFINNFGQSFNNETNPDIIKKINSLDKKARAELRYRLFNEVRKLELRQSGQQAIFWLENCFEVIEQNSFRIHKAYFSPGYDIQDTIITLLKNADSTIDLCVFTITNNQLAKQLINCNKQGIKVRLITDDEKTLAHGSEIFHLEKAGIPIKIDHSRYHMHNKFGIIDDRIVLTGNFNWTYTATKHNQENLLITSNFDIVEQYKDEYKRLWKEMFRF